jgi:hypothetical protein
MGMFLDSLEVGEVVRPVRFERTAFCSGGRENRLGSGGCYGLGYGLQLARVANARRCSPMCGKLTADHLD